MARRQVAAPGTNLPGGVEEANALPPGYVWQTAPDGSRIMVPEWFGPTARPPGTGGFWSQAGDYVGDALTGGPARRLGAAVADGNWEGAGLQAINMGGTPLGAAVMGGSPAGAPPVPWHNENGDWTGPEGIGNVRNGTLNAFGLPGQSAQPGGAGAGGGSYHDLIGRASEDVRASGQRAAAAYTDSRNRQLSYYNPANSAYQQLYGGSTYRPPAQNQTPYGRPQQSPYTPPKPQASGPSGYGGGSPYGGAGLLGGYGGTSGGKGGISGPSDWQMAARTMPGSSGLGGSSGANQGGGSFPASSGGQQPVRRPPGPSAGQALAGTPPGYQEPPDYGPAGTEGMPTQQRDYQAGANQRMSGPTNAQQWFNAYQPSTYMQNYTANRQRTGYGPNAVADRYTQRQGSAGEQSNAQGLLGGMNPWATSGQNQSTGRMAERRALGPTQTGSMLGELAGMAPSARGDRLASGVSTMRVGANAQTAQDRILGGETAGGQMLGRMTAGGGNSGRFMAGFDPTKTMGLGATAAKLAGEGPTYEEDFYTSQLAGTNPAHLRALERVRKESRNAAAARGGFVSGKAIDNEQRGVTALEDAEFARLGDLAGMAGSARRDRLGQELAGSQALDNNFLGRQQLQAQTGLGREGIMSDLARSGDDQYGTLAMSRDDNELKRTGILSDLARAGDSNALDLGRLRVDASGQEDSLQAQRQNALDSLAGQADATDLSRRQLLSTTATSADNTKTQRDRDLDLLAGTTSQSEFDRQRALDDLAGRSADEIYRGQQLGGQLASGADSSNMAMEDRLRLAAQGASDEQRMAAKDKFDAAMALGDAQSKITAAMDAAAIGAVTASDIAALDAALAAAGVSAADRQAAKDRIAGVIGAVGSSIVSNYGGGGGTKGRSTYGDPDGSPETD